MRERLDGWRGLRAGSFFTRRHGLWGLRTGLYKSSWAASTAPGRWAALFNNYQLSRSHSTQEVRRMLRPGPYAETLMGAWNHLPWWPGPQKNFKTQPSEVAHLSKRERKKRRRIYRLSTNKRRNTHS